MTWPRNKHSFARDDPDITLTRAYAVRMLNQLEMWDDVVTRISGKNDPALHAVIAELTRLLEA